MRKFNIIFVTHQRNSSTRKNAGPRLMSTSRDDRSSKCVSAFRGPSISLENSVVLFAITNGSTDRLKLKQKNLTPM